MMARLMKERPHHTQARLILLLGSFNTHRKSHVETCSFPPSLLMLLLTAAGCHGFYYKTHI